MLRSATFRIVTLVILITGWLWTSAQVTHAQSALMRPDGAGSNLFQTGATSQRFPFVGLLRQDKSAKPRVVKPHKLPPGQASASSAYVRGEVPPSMLRGKATIGLSPVLSDGPTNTSRPLTANGSFANLLAFTGATWNSTGCNCEPPDTQMAAGRNEITEAVNNNLFVYNRGGTQLTTYPLTQVFQPPNQTVSLTDPKILFDPTAGANGMYYMTMMVCQNAGCGANNWTHMGISLAVTSDPQGSWTVYDYINDGQDLQDQDKLGFSGDKITFAVNEYGCKCGAGSSFKQENIVVIQKSDAIAGNTINPVVDSTNSTNSFIFDSMPTTPVNGSTSDNTQYVVWDLQATSSNQMAVIRITGTPNGNNVDFSNVQKPSLANQTAPPAPVQPGACFDNLNNPIACTISGDKQNFQSAMVQGNDLWTVATDGCTPQYPSADTTTRDCTRLVEVDLSGGGSSVVTDSDIGTDGTYRYNPSITKDGAGHMYFGFTISSSSQYPTAALDASALPIPAVFERIDYATGDATYTGSRWGDYSGTQQDPANTNDVWSAQEIGGCSVVCGSGFWGTGIGQFTFVDPHITSISPTHGPASGSTTVDIFGSEFANGGTSVNFGGTAASSISWIDSTHIQAVSPPEDSGTVDITATTGAGTSNTSSSDQFTYNPVLVSVSPPNGPAGGGQSVTISGAGLNGASAVSFGGTPASSFTIVDSSTITAVTPVHAGGTVNLTVTTASGTSNAVSYTFMFPTTISLASSANPSGVGQSVTFTATVNPVPDGGTVAFSDNGNPVATCQTVAVNTSTGAAMCTVTYNAVGNHSLVATYSGDFSYSGNTSGALVQQVTYTIKVLYDQTKVNNSGASIPVKVELDDAAGNNVSSASIVLTVAGLSPSPAPGTAPSGTFTFMLLGTGPGYQLNVKATKYPKHMYTLTFTATGDPVSHTVHFIIG